MNDVATIYRPLCMGKKVEKAWNELLDFLQEDYDSPTQWKKIYHFVHESYQVDVDKRPSVSALVTLLQQKTYNDLVV